MPSRPPELGRQPPPLGCKGPWGHPGTGLQTAARSGLHPYLHTPTHLCVGAHLRAHTSPCRPTCLTCTPQWHLAPLPCEMAPTHLEPMSPTPSPGPAHTGAPPASPGKSRTPAKPPPDPRPSPPSLCFLSRDESGPRGSGAAAECTQPRVGTTRGQRAAPSRTRLCLAGGGILVHTRLRLGTGRLVRGLLSTRSAEGRHASRGGPGRAPAAAPGQAMCPGRGVRGQA